MKQAITDVRQEIVSGDPPCTAETTHHTRHVVVKGPGMLGRGSPVASHTI